VRGGEEAPKVFFTAPLSLRISPCASVSTVPAGAGGTFSEQKPAMLRDRSKTKTLELESGSMAQVKLAPCVSESM
jgi:hypothetical protein